MGQNHNVIPSPLPNPPVICTFNSACPLALLLRRKIEEVEAVALKAKRLLVLTVWTTQQTTVQIGQGKEE